MFGKLVLASMAMSLGLVGQVSSAPLVGAANGGACNLQGTANITPGLNSSAQNFSYTFTGTLSSCQSTTAGSPASGNIAAGQLYSAVTSSGPDPANPTVTITHTEHFYEPVATGNGSCGNSTTAGTALVNWADGTITVVSYTTTGAAAAVALQGTVLDSIALTAPDHLYTWEPTTVTVTSSRYKGGSSQAALAFQPPDPTACNTPAGVTVAGISGVATLTQ